MKVSILKGENKSIRGDIWRLVSRIDSLKIELIGKHNNKYNSLELYHYYRDQINEKISVKI